jgi:hypothetical protein
MSRFAARYSVTPAGVVSRQTGRLPDARDGHDGCIRGSTDDDADDGDNEKGDQREEVDKHVLVPFKELRSDVSAPAH